MDVSAATASYEAWLARFCPLHAPDLAYKHTQMADANDPFPFFRGTYYRWVTLYPVTCPTLTAAPHALSVGDLHVENFGTWRDACCPAQTLTSFSPHSATWKRFPT